MSNNRLFGTDGIRTRAGEFPLNGAAVSAIGQAIGEKLGGRILVGQDTRLSSPWILELLVEGIRKTSAHIEDAGVIPTPAIALLTKSNDLAGGIMISASHNPYDDNGIKVFSSDGRKLNDSDEIAIEASIGHRINYLFQNTEFIPGYRTVDLAVPALRFAITPTISR